MSFARRVAMLRVLPVALSLALPAIAPAQQPASSADPGFDVIRYSVALRPDVETGSVSGTETIRLTARRDLNTIELSPNSLSIQGARLNGRPAAFASTENATIFRPATTLRAGQTAILHIAFRGKPKRGLATLEEAIYSSYFACDWMFCLQNNPGDKAWFDLDLYLPSAWASVGIGRRLHPASTKNGRSIHRWRSSRPHSAYLFGFAAGRLQFAHQQHAGKRLIFVNATGAAAELERLFANTADISDFFAAKAGAALPDNQYTQVLVPRGEAQEAATFSLIGAEPLNRDLSDPSRQWIIAHEMAHQWWGNLVTCATWQDFWLNEGFATFMTAAWKQHRFGDAAYEADLDLARARVKRAAELGYDKPLAWSGNYPSLGVRRAVQYSKGALFLHHLRQDLGESAFWKGMSAYTKKHVGKTVRSSDFEQAMEAASGRDLSEVFNRWVYGAPDATQPLPG